MKTQLFFILIIVAAFSLEVRSQTTVGFDIDPDGSALLDIRNQDPGLSTKGFLIPRVAGLDTTQFALEGNSQTEGMLVYNTTAGANNSGNGLYYWNGTRWTYMKAYNNSGWVTGGNTNGAIRTIGTNDAMDLPVIANNQEVMRIKANGRVGVGTSDPQSVMSVSNGAFAQADFADGEKLLLMKHNKASMIAHTGGWGFSSFSGIIANAAGVNQSGNSGKFSWNVADAGNTWREVMKLNNNGALGIGTSNPTARLHVVGDNTILRGQLTLRNATASTPTDQTLAADASGVVTKGVADLNRIPQQYRYSILNLATGATGSVTVGARTSTYYLNVYTFNGCSRAGSATFMVGQGGGVLAFLGGTAREGYYASTVLDTQGKLIRLTATMTPCNDGGGDHQFDFDVAISGNTISVTNRNGTTNQNYEIVVIER